MSLDEPFEIIDVTELIDDDEVTKPIPVNTLFELLDHCKVNT